MKIMVYPSEILGCSVARVYGSVYYKQLRIDRGKPPRSVGRPSCPGSPRPIASTIHPPSAELQSRRKKPTKGELRMAERHLNPEQRVEHWRKTSTLMWTLLILWFIFSFVVHIFAPWLNGIRVLGFPLGFYMAAQGSLVVFVILCFWNAFAQERIDHEFGVSDEE